MKNFCLLCILFVIIIHLDARDIEHCILWYTVHIPHPLSKDQDNGQVTS